MSTLPSPTHPSVKLAGGATRAEVIKPSPMQQQTIVKIGTNQRW